LRITLLGTFQVTASERVIDDDRWRLRKAKTLVKLLALAPHGTLHRDELLDLLWPELEPAGAVNNLRYAIHVARRVLEPETDGIRRFLRWQGERMALAPDSAIEVDVVLFEAAAVAARHARDRSAFEQAIDLYNGDLLPEDRYEDWAAGRREGLRETFLGLLLDLARLHETAREFQHAIDRLRQAIVVDPTREDAHVRLMRVYAASGQRRLALRQYDHLSDVLRTELDVEPEEATKRLHTDLLAGRLSPVDGSSSDVSGVTGDSSPLRRRHNLPVALTSFVGRQREMVAVRDLLGTTRLLTITGIGGIGKTRLALELASEMVDEFEHGVWLVELGPVSDGRLVEQTLARVVGAQEEAGRPLRETLADVLGERQLLLILDNCEHVIQPSAELAALLLTRCPGTRLLVTSREALGIPGEVVWPAPPLSLPPPAGVDPRSLLESESARLFVDRARYRQPSFELTAENALAVGEICQRVQGLPLPIELAAARIAVLTPEEIASRLDDALTLLAGGGRLTEPRHRSLRGVLDWSYRLLSEPEQELLVSLSVFAGGWTLDAAGAIATDRGSAPRDIQRGDVLDLLSQLVDKSLVGAATSSDAATRYSLLEPVRQYATERLEASGNASYARSGHARWFVELAERAEPELSAAQQARWLQRLELEHDNMRAALAWSLENDTELTGRLLSALWRFWWVHGHLSEGQRWLERTLSIADRLSPPARAMALKAAGSLAWAQGDYDRSLPLIEEALTLFRELADPIGVRDALSALGSILANRGDYQRARAAHEEGLALVRASGDAVGIETALGNLADIAYYQGDYESARTWWEESLDLQRESGGEYGVAIILNNLAELARNQGEFDRATPLLEEALALFRAVDFKHGIAIALCNLADVPAIQLDRGKAAGLLRESLTVARDLRNAVVSASCLDVAAKLMVAQRQAEHAARLFGAADARRLAAGAALSPADRSILQPAIDAARAHLDDAIWLAAWNAGAALSAEQAIGDALAGLEQSVAMATPDSRTVIDPSVPELTVRERDVALLVARGLTNRQVASALRMANRTVDTHVGSILRKLGLASRAGLRAWALDRDLLAAGDQESPLPPTHT